MLQRNDNIRTQKMNIENLNWRKQDLEAALNKRIRHFSLRKVQYYYELFDEGVQQEDCDLVFNLSNSNPRDLWHLFNAMMLAEYQISSQSSQISRQAVRAGFENFVSRFNYYEYYPRPEKARANAMDVYAYIRHLSRLSDIEFTRNQLVEKAGITGGSASNYVGAMESMGLIRSKGQQGGSIVYEVRDPKVQFAIKNKIQITN